MKLKLVAKVNKTAADSRYDREVWEGWTVQNFIDELEPEFNMIMQNQSSDWLRGGHKPFKDKNELKKWCMDNQPYYKKHIPEVYEYFLKKTNL